MKAELVKQKNFYDCRDVRIAALTFMALDRLDVPFVPIGDTADGDYHQLYYVDNVDHYLIEKEISKVESELLDDDELREQFEEYALKKQKLFSQHYI